MFNFRALLITHYINNTYIGIILIITPNVKLLFCSCSLSSQYVSPYNVLFYRLFSSFLHVGKLLLFSVYRCDPVFFPDK